MNQKAALCDALLKGEKVSIMTGFRKFGLTNIPREIGRSIEREFDVEVEREHIKSKTRYNTPCNYVEYRLPHSRKNKAGIKKMRAYVNQIKKAS